MHQVQGTPQARDAAGSAAGPLAAWPRPRRTLLGPPAADLFGSPTVLLFAAALAVCAAGVAGHLTGTLPAPAVVLVDALGLYLVFTVLHDAVHGVAHRRPWAGRLLGTVAGYLLTFTYPFFRGVHLRHHARTNQPGQDPDVVTARLPRRLAPLLGGFVIYASYHWAFYRRRLWRTRAECVEVVACELSYLGFLAAAITGGWLVDLLILWVLPLVATLHVLVYTFDYLPHHPHDSTHRLYSARAYGGRLAAVLHLNQNFHLVHHLWPRIPWFRYRQAFGETAEPLAALGCRVSWTTTPLPPGAAGSGSAPEIADRQVGGELARER